MSDTRKAHNATRRNARYGPCTNFPDTCAFQYNTRLKLRAGNIGGVVGRTDSAYEFALGSRLNPVQDVDFEPKLHSEQRSEEADRSCTRNEHSAWLPESAPAHC